MKDLFIKPYVKQSVMALSLAGAVLGVVQLAGCQSEAEAAPVVKKIVSVRVAPVEKREIQEHFVFSGTTRALDHAAVTFQVSGTLKARSVVIGDSVKVGNKLAVVYNPKVIPERDSAKAKLNELRAKYEQAKRDAKRANQLFASDAATQEEVEQTNARRDALKASLGTAKAMLQQSEQMVDELSLIAPFSGTVDQVFFEPGEFVQAGRPVLSISSLEQVELELGLPENLISFVSLGDEVSINFPLLNNSSMHSGIVTEIGTTNSKQGQLFPVVVRVDGDKVRPGITAEVTFTQNLPAQLSVPIRAVMDNGNGESSVYVVKDNVVSREKITPLFLFGERVAINANVGSNTFDENTSIIYAGLSRVSENDTVRVLP